MCKTEAIKQHGIYIPSDTVERRPLNRAALSYAAGWEFDIRQPSHTETTGIRLNVKHGKNRKKHPCGVYIFICVYVFVSVRTHTGRVGNGSI